MRQLSLTAAKTLRDFIAGDGWVYPAADGEVQLICESLPGRGVVGVIRRGIVLTIVVDIDKPRARDHLRELIEHWPLDAAAGRTPDEVVAALTPFPAAVQAPELTPVVIGKISPWAS